MMALLTAKMKIKRTLCMAIIAMLFFIIIADSHLSQANRPQKRFFRKLVARNAMERAARNLRNLMQTRGKVFLIPNQQYGTVLQYPGLSLCLSVCLSVWLSLGLSVCLLFCPTHSEDFSVKFVGALSFIQCNFGAKHEKSRILDASNLINNQSSF